jgi:hypothetical protein
MEILARRRNMKHEIVGIRLRLTVVVLALTVASSAQQTLPPANPAVTGKGTVDFIPMWDTSSDIINSVIFQKSLAIGIGTTAPAATLDVNGKGDIRDTLTLFPKSTDSTLAVNGTAFKISNTGAVTFISGQTFPGAGTITGITTAPGSGLSGGGTTGTLTLKVPAAGITNAMPIKPHSVRVHGDYCRQDPSSITLQIGITDIGQLLAVTGKTDLRRGEPCRTRPIVEPRGGWLVPHRLSALW